MEIGRTRRKISQNGAREKIAPSWGICGEEKTKMEESECTFSFHCARKSNPCFERQLRGRSDRNLITRKTGPGGGGRRAAFVIASSDNICIPIPITSSHTIIDEAAAYLIFLLHFQPTAEERERGGGVERSMKEEITKIIKSQEEVSGGVGVGGG